MRSVPAGGCPAALKNAVWGSAPEMLTLWHGEQMLVLPGDRVFFYEPADGTLIFVDAGKTNSATVGCDGHA